MKQYLQPHQNLLAKMHLGITSFSSPFAGDPPNLHELEQFLGALPEIVVQLKVKSLGTLKIVDTYQLCLILPQTLVVCYPLLNRPSC